ncbi:carboxypeptidase [Elysia marginata]|uniref:Carboxypeptidase n=1 Tax=Elysia marginata TaxID=1093978 RepID=A0AAV4HJV7_9GAST|nr:carboxypeptidase [Elysia marginata]
MLYIDNPVGVGYSYQERESPDEVITQDTYSKDLYKFVEQFYQLFPDSYNKELYIGGQSYGAKYVTAFAYQLHKKKSRGESNITLTGIYMGGPFFAPEIMLPVLLDYFFNLGVASRSEVVTYRETMAEILQRYSSGLMPTNVTANEILSAVMPKNILFSDNYITRERPGYYLVEDIMTSERIRQAVHVANLSFSAAGTTMHDKLG